MGRDIRVGVRVNPAADTEMFRVGAADDILRLLVDAHDEEFTVPELADVTGASRSTVWRAVDLLDDLDVLQIRQTPQRNYVSIATAVLEKDDPILAIDQPEYHAPVRAFLEGVRETVDDTDAIDRLVGVVVFGSVARGEADRQSDVDVFVVVDGDRTVARRRVADVASDLRSRRFDGDRYEFEQYVESIDSATRASDKLRELFDDGITIYENDGLQRLRRAVMTDE